MRLQVRGLWANPNFTNLWAGRTISNIGNGITGLALPLTAILFLSATPIQIGILGALDGLAVLFFAFVAGVWVDRLYRRSILIFTDIARALLLASVPIAALLGILHLVQVYVVATLVSILTVFFNAADASFLPELVQANELIEGNSKLGISDSLAEIAGCSWSCRSSSGTAFHKPTYRRCLYFNLFNSRGKLTSESCSRSSSWSSEREYSISNKRWHSCERTPCRDSGNVNWYKADSADRRHRDYAGRTLVIMFTCS